MAESRLFPDNPAYSRVMFFGNFLPESGLSRTAQRSVPTFQGCNADRSLQICDAEVRLSRMLMMRDTLSWYCGSSFSFIQTGDAENPCQCCLWAASSSPQVM